MSGITTIVAVIALLTGLIAVWLVTDAINKIEKRTKRMVDSQTKLLQQSVSEIARVVKEQKENQDTMTNRVRDVVRNREAADVELAALRQDLSALAKALTEAAPGAKSRSRRR